MNYSVQIKASARKALQKIVPDDRERILAKIVALRNDPRPQGAIKLTNKNAYRIRQGDYRIIYSIQDQQCIVAVIRIGNRRDIYKK